MKVCVYLSYIGLGANLLHLSYVHQLSEKFGPITVFTLCNNLSDALEDDPKIKEVNFATSIEEPPPKPITPVALIFFPYSIAFKRVFNDGSASTS